MLIDKKERLTTLVLAIGFFLLAISDVLGWLTRPSDANFSDVVRREILICTTGFVVSVLLFLIYARIEKRLSGVRLMLSAAALCYGGGMLWRLITSLSLHHMGLNPGFKADYGLLLVRGGLMDGTALGSISFLYFGIAHWRQASEQKEKARQAIALAHQAQLQMLRYQLNPHFLFNALNSIRGMIIEDPERSREMIGELADFLRYSLDSQDQENTIADELRAIENYLAIQRIRFEENLDATVRVDPSVLQVSVPCFLIHPLVENAVKYGMKTSAMPLQVQIIVARDGDRINIRVANTGRLQARSGEDGQGVLPDGARVGLKNISERLKLVFPDRHAFELRESDGWVHAEICLDLTAQEPENEVTHSDHRR